MKPRVAFFDFAGCEGDQLQVVNIEEHLLELLELVEVVSFREAMTEHSDDYDIAFIEGSITRASDEQRLKDIRKNAKLLVAIGACATIGGINSIKNVQDMEDVKQYVYGDGAKHFDTYPTRPIDAVVRVDAYVHGCPIDRKEFLSVVKSLLLGKKPELPNYPVCVECKKAENICVFENGEFCLGPVTRAGCGACCVTQGSICWGCRGFVDDPNKDAEKEVLAKYGLAAKDVIDKFHLYTANSELAK
ncbi:MAG: NADH:ubiquinone oxidoreductase [Planctomycetes bacterium]|nr:NADH:ubiquinone oxidoreductase [Planctomycetota bacterium]